MVTRKEKMFAVGLLREKRGVYGFELPKPRITRPTEVLTRIVENGICGTDTNMVKYGYKDFDEGQDAMALGHEMHGIVEEVGKAVKNFRPGDHVTMPVRRGCGLCVPCNYKKSDFCQTGLFKERGIHKLDGFLTEYTVDDEEWLVKVPKGLEKYAAASEPLSVVEKALEQVKYVQSRAPWSCGHREHSWQSNEWGGCKRGVVLGVGPIGFLAAALMRLGGMETTVISRTSESDGRVKMIKKLGCDYQSVSHKPVEEVCAEMASGNQRIDFLFEAAGAPELAFRAIPFVSRSGACVLTGIPHKEVRASLDQKQGPTTSLEPSLIDSVMLMRQITRHNLAVVGSVNSNRAHFEQALQNMRKINKKFDQVLDGFFTQRFKLREYQKAFAAEKTMKVLVEIS